MMNAYKQEAAAAISRAQVDLDYALAALDKVPLPDPNGLALQTHQLNNFLTVSSATTELLQILLADHPDPQVLPLLDTILHTNRLIAYTVRQLDAKPSPQDAPLRKLPVQLTVLARRACHYYKRIAERKNIRLTSEIASDVPVIASDGVAVGAVVENFLSNAVKYSPQGALVRLKVECKDNQVRLSVIDEGEGLSLEDQERLFEPGAKLTARPTGGEPSQGFGLAVAKTLIEQLGGQIGCHSEHGVGSCFWFCLPISDAEATTEALVN